MSAAPTDWGAPSSLGSAVPAVPGTDSESKPDDPIAAWAWFWRKIARDLPEHVNRTRTMRGGIRRLGVR